MCKVSTVALPRQSAVGPNNAHVGKYRFLTESLSLFSRYEKFCEQPEQAPASLRQGQMLLDVAGSRITLA